MFIINWGDTEERLDAIYYSVKNSLSIVKNTNLPVKKLRDVVSMQRGRFGHRPRNDPRYYDGQYPFIQTGNIVLASEDNSAIKHTQTLNDLGLSTSRLCSEKSLLITIAANIGYTAILDYDACFPDSLIALKPRKSNIIIEYLNIYLRHIRGYIEALAPQAAQKNINIQQLSPVPIIVPSLKTQQQIVDIMDTAYEKKRQKEKQAKELLDSINSYLLGELGINMPSEEENTMNNRKFYVDSGKVIGSRFDPRKYTKKYQMLFAAIENSPFNKKRLRDVITNDVSGNWGLDETEKDEDLIYCLTIRATEFDNRYNLNLDNNRTKFRKFTQSIFDKITLSTNDILIEKSGGSDDQPVGRVAFIEKEMLEDQSLAYSNFIHKITINESVANPRYVFEFLRLIHNIKITEVMQTQTNGIRNLIMKEFFTQTIILPDVDKQQEIATEASNARKKAKVLEEEAVDVIKAAKCKVEKILLEGNL